VTPPHRLTLRWLAGALIGASVLAGILSICLRLADVGTAALRASEGATLLLAASAYLAYALGHYRDRRDQITRSILIVAFALWAVVQLAPTFSGAALLNDLTILLFVADLAILLSPAR
jgi:hypothetical protein